MALSVVSVGAMIERLIFYRRHADDVDKLGNNAPFVGLLGTVIGVINAFHALGDSNAAKGGMGNVMAAIAEALVATGVGLVVALPAVVAYNVAQKKASNIEANVGILAKQ